MRMWIKKFLCEIFTIAGCGNYNNFAEKSKSHECIRIQNRDVGRLYSNASFDFGADQNHGMNTGILTEFLPLWNSSDCTNFVYKYINSA